MREIDTNVHIQSLLVNGEGTYERSVLLITDPHWDHPKCDREALKRHLDQAKKHNARVIIAGDLFCVMQGKNDKRSAKDDIRPEHQCEPYFDTVIKDAVEWFKPYAENIDVIGRGNHEQALKKHHEFDILERFEKDLNAAAKPSTPVKVGGYGGWYVLQYKNKRGKTLMSYKIKYFHGSGGGSPVTKGTIGHERMAAYVENADCVLMGHNHNDYESTITKEVLDGHYNIKLKETLMVRTASYKEEYNNQKEGFHAERGGRPKPIGGRWLVLRLSRNAHKPNKNWELTGRTIKAD